MKKEFGNGFIFRALFISLFMDSYNGNMCHKNVCCGSRLIFKDSHTILYGFV